jgi:hypothetical protein
MKMEAGELGKKSVEEFVEVCADQFPVFPLEQDIVCGR